MADGRRIVDLFAGAGGWDEGLHQIGHEAIGIEFDKLACATGRAAGHARVCADVAALDPHNFAPLWGLIASPPCQAYSSAGKRLGQIDKPHVIACAHELAAGSDSRAEHGAACRDPRSMLTVEPLRWALALRPRWIALEQVPRVLDLWSLFVSLLAAHGYHATAGVLSAEQYGVPQTRKRAFLIASLDGPVQLPAPTHRSYHPRKPHQTPASELHLRPWVSMAQALGWSDGGGHATALNPRQFTNRLRPVDAPAITMVATMLATGRPRWVFERPATTIACDRRVQPPGHKANAADPPGRYDGRAGTNAPRVTVEQATVLQGFRRDYPWQGSRHQQYRQIGNAVPPPLAAHVLTAAMRRAR